MPRIKQTSVVPYTRPVITVNTGARHINTTNALSAETPTKAQTMKDFFGVVSVKAGFVENRDSAPQGFHLSSVKNAWKNRKNP